MEVLHSDMQSTTCIIASLDNDQGPRIDFLIIVLYIFELVQCSNTLCMTQQPYGWVDIVTTCPKNNHTEFQSTSAQHGSWAFTAYLCIDYGIL